MKAKPKLMHITTRRGNVKIKNPKAIAKIKARKLPHTEVRKSKSGKVYKKRIT